MRREETLDLSGLVGARGAAQGGGTAGCGLLNAGYFAGYWWRRNGRRGRRLGAAALLLVNVAAVGEAGFSQGLFLLQQGFIGTLSPGEWALLRLPLFAATLLISLIILRRIRS